MHKSYGSVAVSLAGLSLAAAQDKERCSGHDFLPQPRSETSCASAKPRIYASPDKALHALVLPVGVELSATPDIESRVVVRMVDGKTVTSKDFSSPRGANGYYVERAQWSPDLKFFVFSMSSSGGHSPWSFPTWVFSRDKGLIASFNAMIGDNPTVRGRLQIYRPSHGHGDPHGRSPDRTSTFRSLSILRTRSRTVDASK